MKTSTLRKMDCLAMTIQGGPELLRTLEDGFDLVEDGNVVISVRERRPDPENRDVVVEAFRGRGLSRYLRPMLLTEGNVLLVDGGHKSGLAELCIDGDDRVWFTAEKNPGENRVLASMYNSELLWCDYKDGFFTAKDSFAGPGRPVCPILWSWCEK